MPRNTGIKCHICELETVVEAQGYAELGRTTSDCNPWRSGGRIGCCSACGIVQKILDAAWQQETTEIYSTYNIYHQSPTRSEQPIYLSNSDRWVPRSQAILLHLIELVGQKILEPKISMDIGCGNGATLHAMAQILPNHQRYGYDPTATNIGSLRERTELKITGCSRDLKDLPKSYDLLTMIHVLEHIPNPISVLREYVDMLTPEGYFLIVVPNFLENPFDITIADHCSHFSADTLANLLIHAGLEIINLSTTAISKEIMVVCRRPTSVTKGEISPVSNQNQLNLNAQIEWLHSIREDVRQINLAGNRLGIFGTSIAGNWMYGEWENEIKFFVDEDPDRLGTTFRDVPVLSVSDLGVDDTVYIALPYAIAAKVKQRYADAICAIQIPHPITIEEQITEVA